MHHEKVILINVVTPLLKHDNHPPAFRHTKDGSAQITKKHAAEPIQSPVERPPEGCSHFAVVGERGGGKNGRTFTTLSRDTDFCPFNYNVIFVAIPDEIGAKPWWTLAMAGQMSGNMTGNILGVSIGSSGGPVPPLGETPLNERAFGVPITAFRAFAAAYANSAAEGASFFTVGTENYR